MFIVCWTESDGRNLWAKIDNKDAMQNEVVSLVKRLNCSYEDVRVFEEWKELYPRKEG